MRAVFSIVLLAACGRVGFDTQQRVEDAPLGPDGLPSNLVAYFPMDDLAAGTDLGHRSLRDISRGHDGACSMGVAAGCPSPVAGQLGGALSFDGADDIATVESAVDLELRGGFTVTVWMKLAAVPSKRGCLATKGLTGGSRNSWAICVEPTRHPFFFTSTATTNHALEPAVELEVGAWHHLAVRWDATTKAVFLDGLPIGTAAAAVEFDDQTVRIGGDLDGGSPIALFAGVLDDLRIYDGALSDAAIATLAQP